MKIISKVTNFGFVLDDNGQRMIVTEQGLCSPMVLDTLLAEGWKLQGVNPVKLVSSDGKVDTDNLPEVTEESLGLSDNERQYIYDLAATAYNEKELMLRIDEEVKYAEYKFAEPIKEVINTREELIKYLEFPSSLRNDDIIHLLPLNAITNPEALFTPEEYLLPENGKYRTAIEDRTSLSIIKWRKLLDTLKDFGINENSTAFEINNVYLRWGFPGIKLKPYSIEENMSDLNMIKASNPNLDYKNQLNKISQLGYIESNRNYRPVGDSLGVSAPAKSEAELANIVSKIRSLGHNNVEPLLLESRTPDRIKTYYADDAVISFNSTSFVIDLKGFKTIIGLIDVKVGNLSIPDTEINLLNKNNVEHMKKSLAYNRLAQETIDKATVKSNASTYKVLESVSMDTVSIIRYIIKRSETASEDIHEEIYGYKTPMNKSKASDALSALVLQWARGELEENTKEFEVINDLVIDIIQGNVNLDNTEMGSKLDAASMNLEDLAYRFELADKVCGISIEYLAEDVDKIDMSNTNKITLREGVDKVVDIDVIKTTFKQSGYEKDKMKILADSVPKSIYLYATTAYTELGCNHECPRHIAGRFMQYLTLDSDPAIPLIRNILTQRAESISELTLDVLQGIEISIPQCIFYAYMHDGEVPFPKPLQLKENDTFRVNSEILGYIRNNIQIRIDSLNMVQSSLYQEYTGEIRQIIVNAKIVNNQYLVPKKGYKLREVPFMAIWEGPSGMRPEKYKFAVEQGMYEDELIKTRGLKSFYSRFTINSEQMKDRLGLLEYARTTYDYLDSLPVDVPTYELPQLPYELIYSGLYEEVEMFEQEPAKTEEMFALHPAREIDSNTLYKRMPDLMENEGTGLVIEDKSPSMMVNIMDLPTKELIKEERGILESYDFGDKIKALNVYSDKVEFVDTTMKPAALLSDLADSNYAVGIFNNKPVVQDVKGAYYVYYTYTR